MALSVVSRPQGYSKGTTSVTGTYIKGSSTITKASHGLSTGSIIYIESNEAIGFWYVTVLTANTFTISEYATATVYTFVGTGSLNYYSCTQVTTVTAVHLPIVYKLKSTAWPTNSVDTVRTVSSYANDNGYVKITASGTLKSDITELEFVKVTFTGGTTGIYQVLSWYSNSIVTINLAYAGGITFTSIQYYYNNYHARIRVYGGLSSSHYFGSLKPYTLLTEQKIIPDSNGLISFNINEFLKKQIEIIKNDLLKGTLPNNLDAFCQFYITYAEGYDYAVGGYTLMDFVSSYTDDSSSFTGYAVNADMPFKNIYSGHLTDYVTLSSASKFLTPSLYPELTPGQYFDISFINRIGSATRVLIERYVNSTIINSTVQDISDYGIGIYRLSLTQSAYLEDRIDIRIQWNDYVGWQTITETKTLTINQECQRNAINLCWLNYLGGFDWKTFTSNSDFGATIENTSTVEKNIFTNWPKSFGEGADTITQQTSRDSRKNITLRAENLTENQINDLYRIRLSPLVQIVNSVGDRRTVLVDNGSFVYLQQGEKLFNLTFNVSLTDQNPSQSL